LSYLDTIFFIIYYLKFNLIYIFANEDGFCSTSSCGAELKGNTVKISDYPRSCKFCAICKAFLLSIFNCHWSTNDWEGAEIKQARRPAVFYCSKLSGEGYKNKW